MNRQKLRPRVALIHYVVKIAGREEILVRAQTLVPGVLVQRKQSVAVELYVGFLVSRTVLTPGFIALTEKKRLRPNPGTIAVDAVLLLLFVFKDWKMAGGH